LGNDRSLVRSESMKGAGLFLMLVFLVGYLPASFSWALEPNEILVLANRNAAKSVGLAKYYMERRGIPEKNLLPLRITDKEWCEREDYEKRVAAPVREHLKEKDLKREIRCILVLYGFPLKVAPPGMTENEKEEVASLQKRQEALKARIDQLKNGDSQDAKKAGEELEIIRKQISRLRKEDQTASLDSEISLALMENYGLSGWIPNPFFAGYKAKDVARNRDNVMMVSRLDGPTEETVRRVMDESMETEKRGLTGKAYFDARWPRPSEEKNKKTDMGYGFYDRSIHRAADVVKKSGRLPVVVNDKPELFQPGECPDAALYCGWYSLAHYVDAFQWRPGSVGYHIASSECQTLKQKASQVWCKRMLEEGIAATAGPVGEPYVQAFPIPEMFFEFLLEGSWTLSECYALSQPFWSWQMVLIGDPLYSPFRTRQ